MGAKDLHKTHERLISLKSDYSQTCDSLKNKKAELENLERKNKLLERDVERYKNRQNYLRDIKHLTFKKFWVVCGTCSSYKVVLNMVGGSGCRWEGRWQGVWWLL